MRTIIIIVIINLFSLAHSFAQDIIYLKTGEEKKSIVVEIDDINIKYKNFEQTDGPVRTVAKNDVFMILYKDGSKEKFMNNESSNPGISNADKETFKGIVINTLILKEIIRKETSSARIYQNYIQGIMCSPSANKLLFYTYDKGGNEFSFDLFDLETALFTHIRNKATFKASGFLQACFGFSQNTDQCFTILNENYLQIFNTRTGDELYHYKGKKEFYNLKISPPGISYDQETNRIKPDKSYLIVGDKNYVKKLADETDYMNFFRTGVPDYTLKISKDAGEVEFSPSGTLVASNSGIFPKKLFVCELITGNLLANLEEPPNALIISKMRFSRDEKYLIAIHGKEIFVWEVSTGKFVKQLQVHEKSLFDFDISKDNILVTSGLDETLNFWDINNGFKKIISINPTKRNGKPVCSSHVNFSSDGKKLYAVTFSNELIVWDLTIQ